MSKFKILTIYLIIITVVILVVDSGITANFRNWLHFKIPNLDKVGHFFGMGILSFLVLSVISKPTQKTVITPGIISGIILVVLAVTLEEFSQKYIPSRSFQYWDLVADYLGIGLFSLLSVIINHRRANQFKPEIIK